jgi:3-methyladenine DNA glycosylase AlkD
MDFKEAMAMLEAAGTEQNRKIYRRHGAVENMFGVSYGNMEKFAKQIKVDSALAKQLYATGNHDAQVLACCIADPAALSETELDDMAAGLAWYGVGETFVPRLAVKSPHAHKLMRRWLKSKDEKVSRCGYNLAACITRGGKGVEPLAEEELSSILATIEKEIHKAPNRKREAMNGCLIAIGMWGGDKLKEQALAAAERIGEVYIDHGETGCKTPDARTYILKTRPTRATVGPARGPVKKAAAKAEKSKVT